VCSIFCVNLLEESGIFLNLGSFLNERVLAVDFLDLLGLETILGLKICDFSKFFIDVADLLLKRPKEWFILLVYRLGFDFGVLRFLWLWFF